MTTYLDQFCWCALQVTLFAAVGSAIYLLLRKSSPLKTLLPARCLAVVTLLTIAALIPWQGWQWLHPRQANHALSFSATSPHHPDMSALDFDSRNEQTPTPQPAEVTEFPPSAQTQASQRSSPAPISLSFDFNSWKKYFALLAGILFLITLLRLVIAIRELSLCTRLSSLIEDPDAENLLLKLQTRFQLHQKILLKESTRCKVPATIAWRKPILLLPTSWRDWSPEQLQVVLAHELAHVQNRDFFIWSAVQLPLLLHSYHPLVHWLARRVRWEQELAADRKAVRISGDLQGYRTALAELALGQTKSNRLLNNLSFAPSSSMLLERLKMLNHTDFQTENSAPRLRRTLLATALVLSGFAASGLRGTQSPAIADETLQASNSQTDSLSNPASDTNRIENSVPQNKSTDSHEEIVISAVLKVISTMGTGNQSPLIRQKESAIVLNTHAARLRGTSILKSAIAREIDSESSLLITKENRIEWLTSNLKVSILPESNMLRVELHGCPKAESANGKKLVDAIIEIYQLEIRMKEHAQNDERLKELVNMRDEITETLRIKIDKRNAIAKELGGVESDVSSALSQLASRRLDRIENNLDRLEEDLLRLELELEETNEEPSNEQMIQIKFNRQRIAQLTERQDQLVEELEKRNTPSAILTTMDAEIEQLQEVAKTLLLNQYTESRKHDVSIQVLQHATVDTTTSNDKASSNRVRR